MIAEVISVHTTQGLARLYLSPVAGRPRATVVLGHGAGGGVDAHDLVCLADELPQRGYSVVRVEQPWRVAGRRVATPAPRLDEAWIQCVQAIPATLAQQSPLVVGGRSAGARVACRTASLVGAQAVLALSFPLHPPGRPQRSRLAELVASANRPVLVVQGDCDAFGVPQEFGVVAHQVTVRAVPGADHLFRIARSKVSIVTQGEAGEVVASLVTRWLNDERESKIR